MLPICYLPFGRNLDFLWKKIFITPTTEEPNLRIINKDAVRVQMTRLGQRWKVKRKKGCDRKELEVRKVGGSVTRLGDFLHFGQPFKAGGNNYFTQTSYIVRQFL